MRPKLFTCALFVSFLNSIIFAQTLNENCPEYFTHAKIIDSEVRIANVEVKDSENYSSLPEFKGDIDSISKLIVYPDIAKRAEIECNVKLAIIIDSIGYAVKVKILKGCGAGLEEAALDVLQNEKFYPAKINNKEVSSEIIVDIMFDLNIYIDKPNILLDEIKYELNANMPYHKKTLIFKSDGKAFLSEDRGYESSIKKQIGKIYLSYFSKLNDFILSQCFFDYKDEYINQSPSDYPLIKVSVQKGDFTKSVTIKGESHDPVGFWAISSLILYVGDQIKWEEVKE
jgi:TonB family protein